MIGISGQKVSGKLDRVDAYLANGDPEVGLGNQLSRILTGPYAKQFINQAAELNDVGGSAEPKIPQKVYLALSMAALVAVAASGCISADDNSGNSAENVSTAQVDALHAQQIGYSSAEEALLKDISNHPEKYTVEAISRKHEIKVPITKQSMKLGSDPKGPKEYSFSVGTQDYKLGVELPKDLCDSSSAQNWQDERNNAANTQAFEELVADGKMYKYGGKYFFSQGVDETAVQAEHSQKVHEAFSKMVDNPADDLTIKGIVDELSKLASSQQGYYTVDYVVGFVQEGIVYDETWGGVENRLTLEPMEVLCTQHGVCDSKAGLLAEMLKQIGYDVALMTFSEEDHRAVGIKCPPGSPYDYRDTGYVFVEAAKVHRIGKPADKYTNGKSLKSNPEITPFTNGGRTFDEIDEIMKRDEQLAAVYGKEYLSEGPEVRILMIERSELDKTQSGLNGLITASRVKTGPWEKERASLNAEIDEKGKQLADFKNSSGYNVPDYTRLVSEKNALRDKIMAVNAKYNPEIRRRNILVGALNNESKVYNNLGVRYNELTGNA
jgi:hypothetical protein